MANPEAAEAAEPIDSMGLADALDLLRTEVAAAQQRAAGAGVRFPIQSLTVEFKVGLTRRAGGRAGFKVPFLEAGGDGSIAKETVHTVTVVLGAPADASGRPVRVTGQGNTLKG
ncbi:trypco2 family protein [Actinomadura sp. NPDC048032]|uniref:trypco2 family protein n=1 Tax=Actinomadura sp. NPDC048032 TaxID=3155747 RepID=UPI0033EA2E26